MLTKIKKYALKLMYEYHYHMENYYLGKINNHITKHNEHWWDKVLQHADKEFKLVRKLVKLEEA